MSQAVWDLGPVLLALVYAGPFRYYPISIGLQFWAVLKFFFQALRSSSRGILVSYGQDPGPRMWLWENGVFVDPNLEPQSISLALAV